MTTTESGTDSDTPVLSERTNLPRRHLSGIYRSSRIIPTLRDMAVYTKAFKWRTFRHAECKLFNHVFSFSETKIKELIKSPATNHYVEKHNRKHLMRVYPRITRVTSNNFNPIIFWTKDVQMVALNWQTYDITLAFR